MVQIISETESESYHLSQSEQSADDGHATLLFSILIGLIGGPRYFY